VRVAKRAEDDDDLLSRGFERLRGIRTSASKLKFPPQDTSCSSRALCASSAMVLLAPLLDGGHGSANRSVRLVAMGAMILGSVIALSLVIALLPESPASPSTLVEDASYVRATIYVTGKVQGVYYRDSTQRKGNLLGLKGVVWNLADRRVEIVAEGPKSQIEKLIEWCHLGPEGAYEVGIKNSLSAKRKVDSVSVEWGKAKLDLGDDFRNGGVKQNL